MNVGMLWFDNDPKTALSAKVERAAVYYRNKYGDYPTLCFVHPSMLAVDHTTAAVNSTTAAVNTTTATTQRTATVDSTTAIAQSSGPATTAAPTNNLPVGEPTNIKAGGVEIRPTRSVLPNHFWIGVNGMNIP